MKIRAKRLKNGDIEVVVTRVISPAVLKVFESGSLAEQLEALAIHRELLRAKRRTKGRRER